LAGRKLERPPNLIETLDELVAIKGHASPCNTDIRPHF
jgi:hypothetical protein